MGRRRREKFRFSKSEERRKNSLEIEDKTENGNWKVMVMKARLLDADELVVS
jgi:hypothetical protein